MINLSFKLSVCLLGMGLGLAGCRANPETAKRKHYETGTKYLAEKNYGAAAVAFKNAIQVDGKFGEARAKLSEVHLLLADPRSALVEAVRAADLLPQDTDVQLRAVSLLTLSGQHADARTRAERLLQRHPQDVRAQIALGHALAGMKDLDGALAQIEEAIKLDPANTSAISSLAALQAANGDLEGAEKTFRDAVNRHPDAAAPRLSLVQFLWLQKRLPEAEALLVETVRSWPNDMMANRVLADILWETGRTRAAEPYLKAAVRLDDRPATRLSLADYYIAENRHRDAVPLLQGLAADPQLGIAAHTRLATIEAEAGHRDAAVGMVEQILQRAPQDVSALLLKADLLTADKKPTEALAVADRAVTADPRSIAAHFARGRLLALANKTDQAKLAFNEVLRLNPRAAAAQVELARLHLEEGAGATAVTMATAAVKIAPRSLEARMMLARTLIARHSYPEASRLVDQLVATDPNVAAVFAQRGLLQALEGRKESARQDFERALSLEPFQRDALAGLTALDIAEGRQGEARIRLDAALVKASVDPEISVIAARGFSLLGDTKRVEECLKEALRMNPDTLQAYGMLGQLYVSQRRLDEARDEFERLAARQSRPVASLTMVGMIYQMQGRTSDARQTFTRALEFDPRAGVAANNLAWMHADAGESLDLALQLAQTAKAALPDQPDVDDTLGWIYYQKGLLPMAQRTFERLVTEHPGTALYQFHLGLTYAKVGRTAKARRALEAALRLDPRFSGADEASRLLSQLADGAL